MILGDDEDGLLGLIVIELNKYNMINKRIKLVTFISTCVFLVKDVFSLIMENGYNRYIIIEEEKDCRFWICILVKDLEEVEKALKSAVVDSVSILNFY